MLAWQMYTSPSFILRPCVPWFKQVQLRAPYVGNLVEFCQQRCISCVNTISVLLSPFYRIWNQNSQSLQMCLKLTVNELQSQATCHLICNLHTKQVTENTVMIKKLGGKL